MDHTWIAGRKVPIEPRPKTVVSFSAGCNPDDPPGDYEFWTMKNEDAALHVGRRPAGRDPGERFQMMNGVVGYEQAWKDAQTATLIRPTSAKELVDWLNDVSHSGDAPCARWCQVKGKNMRVVEWTEGGFDLEPVESG